MADKRTGYSAAGIGHGDQADEFEELRRNLGEEPNVFDAAAIDLEQELLGDLEAHAPIDELPAIPLSRPTTAWSTEQVAEAPAGYDAADLEDEFNALLGNTASTGEPAYYEPSPEVHEAAIETPPPAAIKAAAPTVSSPDRDDPFAMLAAMAEKYREPEANAWSDEVETRVEPVFEAPAPRAVAAAASRNLTPELETVDVIERAFHIQDDLDIPELQLPEEPVQQVRYADDLEFDNLLNQISGAGRDEPAAPYAHASSTPIKVPASQGDVRVDLSTGRHNVGFDDLDDTLISASPGATSRGHIELHDGFDDELEFESFEEQTLPPRRRRGLFAAAVLGGLAVFGIAGATAMSFIGSSGGAAPSLIKADHSPIKVRPTVAGGPVIPNANSSVYETVANGTQAVRPDQKKLVTGAEDPIELADELPLNGEDDVADAKSEDRLEEVAEAPANADTMAVAPRRVRTMVVKPDGTLAPAQAKPQAEVKQEKKTAAAKPEKKAATGTDDQTIADAGVEQQTTASIEPQPAVTGAWSVQIASDTSEKGAQAVARRLMSRHSKVIGGQSVSVVKADLGSKGIVWRVRLSAETRDQATSLCNRYKSAGGSCFVSKS